MHPEMERIQNCLAAVRRHTDFVPEVAVVLGSGLGGFADMVKQAAVVPYSEIPGFPVSTAPGHAGRFVFGYVEETPVVVMQGRVHLYEGYTPHDVVLPVRLMNAMGAKILFVTNASGGIRGDLTAGTLMSISDHISALIPNPLIGANIDELGVRFPDMSNAYDKGLRAILRETAKQDYRYNMTLAELYNMTFNFAVEDSPAAFEHVMHFDNCRTAVFDRPWNSRAELPNDRFVRCKNWQEIDRVFAKLSETWGKCCGEDKACDRRII